MARTAQRKKAKSQPQPDQDVTAVTPPKSSPAATGPLAVAMEGGVRQLRADLDKANELLEVHHTQVKHAAKNGWAFLLLDPQQVTDEVKSDRTLRLGPDDEYQNLKDDIEKRGQKTPIRVRPANPNWEPDPVAPHRSSEDFILQSGRRRLAACEEIGVPVLAIVTAVTPENSDSRLDDLIERFSENTLRSDLTGFEQYLSIGEIASHLEGWSQEAVGKLLRIKREEVSVALSVQKFEKDLIAMVGDSVTMLSKRQVRPLISKVKSWIEAGRPSLNRSSEKPEPIKATREAGRVALSNGLSVSAGRSGSIKIELENGSKPSSDQVEFILEAIARGAGRVK